MKTSCLLLLVSFFVTFANAQFVENFSSGNTLNATIWQISITFFKVNIANQLQSNAPNETRSLLLRTSSTVLEKRSCSARLDMYAFQPS